MKTLLGALAVALLASAVPDTAAAQCGSVCARFVKETGETAGHACMSALNNDACIATTSRCTVSRCSTALLTTPEGRIVGQLACGAADNPAWAATTIGAGLPSLLAHLARQLQVAASDPAWRRAD